MDGKAGNENQDRRQVRLMLSVKLVRIRRSCWRRLRRGLASTAACFRLAGMSKLEVRETE